MYNTETRAGSTIQRHVPVSDCKWTPIEYGPRGPFSAIENGPPLWNMDPPCTGIEYADNINECYIPLWER